MPENPLRASDRDREQTAERLRHAAGEGRLLPEELEHRLRATFGARTYGELDTIVRDLPSPGTLASPRPLTRARLRPVLAWVLALAALLLILILMVAGVTLRARTSFAAPIQSSRSALPGPHR